jgi:hypothetical protein
LAAIDVSEHDNAPLDLQLPRGASVRVQLRRHDGSSFAGSASLTIADELPSVLRNWFVQGEDTDGRGQAVVEARMPGRYRLTLRCGHQRHGQDIELRDGEQVAVEHTFASTAPLVVEVVDEHGRPRADLRVTLLRGLRDGVQATTNARGGVRFDAVAAGPHTVELSGSGARGVRWSSHEVDTRGVNRIVAPSTHGTSVVRGTLVTSTGEISKDLTVSVVRHVPDDPFASDAAFARVDPATGRFVADELPPGRFAVIVMDSS